MRWWSGVKFWRGRRATESVTLTSADGREGALHALDGSGKGVGGHDSPEDVHERSRVASLQRWLSGEGKVGAAASPGMAEALQARDGLDDAELPLLWRCTGAAWDWAAYFVALLLRVYDALILLLALRLRLISGASPLARAPLARYYRQRRQGELERRLAEADTYGAFYEAALALDALEGGAVWKASRRDARRLYDRAALLQRLEQLAALYREGDIPRLMFCLRGCLSRDFCGIGRPELHRHSRVGTKVEVEDFINVVSWLLDDLADERDSAVPLPQKLTFFNEVRHAYGRTALLLSGGSTMGLSHFGALKALLEQQLLPRVLSGASAGAVVVSFAGIFTDAELRHCLDTLANPLTGRPFCFEIFGPHLSWRRALRRLAKRGVLFDVRRLQTCMRGNLGDFTFQEAYARTKRIINVTVTPQYGPPVLLNYLTAPNVLVWSAVCASAALPIVFAPVELFAKDENDNIVSFHPEGVRWMDGSLQADVPLQRIGEMFNVNHFIVSQANPHFVPRGSSLMKSRLAKCVKAELKLRYWQLQELGLIPRLARTLFPVLTQPFEGTVTIMRDVNWEDLRKLFRNPTHRELLQAVQRGERLTFYKLDEIRHNCLLETTLDRCIERIRRRMLEASETRLGATATGSAARDGIGGGTRRLLRVPSWLWAADSYGLSASAAAGSSGSGRRSPSYSPAPEDVPIRSGGRARGNKPTMSMSRLDVIEDVEPPTAVLSGVAGEEEEEEWLAQAWSGDARPRAGGTPPDGDVQPGVRAEANWRAALRNASPRLRGRASLDSRTSSTRPPSVRSEESGRTKKEDEVEEEEEEEERVMC